MSSLPSNEFLDAIFKKTDCIAGFKVIWFVTNNLFVSFEIRVRPCNLSQNTLRLKNEFEKCILSLMESLIADFIQLFSAIDKFLFMQGRLGTRLNVHSIS